MVHVVGTPTLDDLINETIPEKIRLRHALNLPPARSEEAALALLREIMDKNEVRQSTLNGLRELPRAGGDSPQHPRESGWYTAYTLPSGDRSGAIEALLNFQTLVCDLTAMDIATPPCSMNRRPLPKPWRWRTPSRAAAPSLSPMIAIPKQLPSFGRAPFRWEFG